MWMKHSTKRYPSAVLVFSNISQMTLKRGTNDNSGKILTCIWIHPSTRTIWAVTWPQASRAEVTVTLCQPWARLGSRTGWLGNEQLGVCTDDIVEQTRLAISERESLIARDIYSWNVWELMHDQRFDPRSRRVKRMKQVVNLVASRFWRHCCKKDKCKRKVRSSFSFTNSV